MGLNVETRLNSNNTNISLKADTHTKIVCQKKIDYIIWTIQYANITGCCKSGRISQQASQHAFLGYSASQSIVALQV